MKKALKLLLTYFILLILIVAAASICYSLYLIITNHVEGSKINFFDAKVFITSFFRVLTSSLIFICPICVYKLIKYKRSFSVFVTYIIICIVNWMILFPISLHFRSIYSDVNFKQERLSERKFREDHNGNIYYFTRDFGTSPLTYQDTPTVVINPENLNAVSIKEIKDTPDFVLYQDAEPYSDVLVKNTISVNKKIKIIEIEKIIDSANLALGKGPSYFLGFLAFAFALCSLYSLLNFFDWRLLTAVSIFTGSLLIILLNSLYYLPAFDLLKENLLLKSNFINYCQNYVQQPLLVIINLLIGILMSLLGIIKFCVIQAKKSKKRKEG